MQDAKITKYTQIYTDARMRKSDKLALVLSRPRDLFSWSRVKRRLTSAKLRPIPCKLSLASAENIFPAPGVFC